MIPPILHYVWVGGPLPAAQQAYIRTWRETNPQFEIIQWDETNIDLSKPIIREALQAKKWAKVADIARLQAVLQMGGIYLDTDFKVFRSLDPLRKHACFYAFQDEEPSSSDWVCNGVFGAERDHWFVKQALDGLYAMQPRRYRPERPTDFGPKHITRLLRDAGLDHYSPEGVTVRDIFIAPVPVFFPFRFDETFTPDCITPETVAAHFWAQSWTASIPFPLRAARSGRNFMRKMLRNAVAR